MAWPEINAKAVSSFRGGSRIPHRRGWANPPGRAPTYDFVKFCEKPHEIEKILGRLEFRVLFRVVLHFWRIFLHNHMEYYQESYVPV